MMTLREHLEAMKPVRCRYVSIGSEACDKSPGYPRDQWCYACDHREHRNAALAILDAAERQGVDGDLCGRGKYALIHDPAGDPSHRGAHRRLWGRA